MIFDNFNYKMFQFSIGEILKCKMKRDFKMGTFGALLLEGGARRAPSAPVGGGRALASTLAKILRNIERNYFINTQVSCIFETMHE